MSDQSNEGAQAPGYFESLGHFSNQDASAIVRVLLYGRARQVLLLGATADT